MTTPSPAPYVYRAEVLSVYDGDTFTAKLDLGMSIFREASCRLHGLDAPEIKTRVAGEKEAAVAARDRVRELTLGKLVLIHSVEKPDKYGRLLVRVWTSDGVCVNDLLVEENLAIPYDGGQKIRWSSWT